MNWHIWMGAAMTLAGIATTVAVMSEFRKAGSTRGWPSTNGIVIESNVETEFEDGTYYRLKLAYRYEVDGKSYVGSRLRSQPAVVWTWAWPARRTARRYMPGSSVRAYYSESEPSESVLQRGVSRSRFVALALVAAMLFGSAWSQLNR